MTPEPTPPRVTAGEWTTKWETYPDMPLNSRCYVHVGGVALGHSHDSPEVPPSEARANGELWAASKDHLMLLRGIMRGNVIIVPSLRQPQLFVDGNRVSLTLYQFGIPLLTPAIRAALEELDRK